MTKTVKRTKPVKFETQGERFKYYRMLCKLTQKQVEQETGIPHDSYSKLENGYKRVDSLNLAFLEKFIRLIRKTASDKNIILNLTPLQLILGEDLNDVAVKDIEKAGIAPDALANIIKIRDSNKFDYTPFFDADLTEPNTLNTLNAILSHPEFISILHVITQWSIDITNAELELAKYRKDIETGEKLKLQINLNTKNKKLKSLYEQYDFINWKLQENLLTFFKMAKNKIVRADIQKTYKKTNPK